jgi:hypothetical protein
MIGAVGTIVLIGLGERFALMAKFGRVLSVTRRDLVLLKDVGKLALASGLAGLAAFVVRTLLIGMKPFVILAACGTVFALLYFVAILVLRVVTSEELDLVRGQVTRLQRRIYWKRAADTLT